MSEIEEKTSHALSLKGILAKQFAAVQEFVFNVSFVAYLFCDPPLPSAHRKEHNFYVYASHAVYRKSKC